MRYLLRLADGEYVEWSTVVDSPVSDILTREQATARFGGDLVDRCDERHHTHPTMDPAPPEQVILGNRAGADESTADLLWIRVAYQAGRDGQFPKLVFTRLPVPVARGDRVTLSDGATGLVETVKVAVDLRDAKCTVWLDAAAPEAQSDR